MSHYVFMVLKRWFQDLLAGFIPQITASFFAAAKIDTLSKQPLAPPPPTLGFTQSSRQLCRESYPQFSKKIAHEFLHMFFLGLNDEKNPQ